MPDAQNHALQHSLTNTIPNLLFNLRASAARVVKPIATDSTHKLSAGGHNSAVDCHPIRSRSTNHGYKVAKAPLVSPPDLFHADVIAPASCAVVTVESTRTPRTTTFNSCSVHSLKTNIAETAKRYPGDAMARNTIRHKSTMSSVAVIVCNP